MEIIQKSHLAVRTGEVSSPKGTEEWALLVLRNSAILASGLVVLRNFPEGPEHGKRPIISKRITQVFFLDDS